MGLETRVTDVAPLLTPDTRKLAAPARPFEIASLDSGVDYMVVSAMPHNKYAARSGTSTATALAAGIAGLQHATRSPLTKAELIDAIMDGLKATLL